MTTHEPFSDAALETVLRRRARSGDPGDLRERATAALEQTRPRRFPWSLRGWMPEIIPAGRLTPVVAVLVLVALLAGALIVGASWLRYERVLVPTVVEVVTPVVLTDSRLVQDGAGNMWALGDGQVTRLDPLAGDRQTWTVSDDTRFMTHVASPARAGGVWTWSGGTISRFTGSMFVDPIPTSSRPIAVAEAPDGTLWALSADHGVQRWADGRWESPGEAIPINDPDTLFASGPDEAWIAGNDDSGYCGPPSPTSPCEVVAHLDHGQWTVYPWSNTAFGPIAPVTLVRALDGTIWAGPAETGAARFDGDRWVPVEGPDKEPVQPLAVAPDSSLWAATGDGRLVRRGPGGRWTAYEPQWDLFGWASPRTTSVAATTEGVFAVAGQRLFQVEKDGWTELWPDPTPGPRPDQFGIRALVGISASEAWAAVVEDVPFGDQEAGLWHFVDGGWEGPTQPRGFEHPVSALALGPNGSLWAADLNRVAVLRSDGWTTAWASENVLVDGGLDVGSDGSAWVGTADGVVHITPTNGGFDVEQVDCPVPGRIVAVATDDTVWVVGGGWGFSAGLASVTGGACELVYLHDVYAAAAYPEGGVVVAYDQANADGTYYSTVVRLRDGRQSLLAEAPANTGTTGVAVAPSGDVWWAYDDPVAAPAGDDGDGGPGGLVRLHGEERVQVVTGGQPEAGPISISPDGTVWFASSTAIYRILPDALP